MTFSYHADYKPNQKCSHYEWGANSSFFRFIVVVRYFPFQVQCTDQVLWLRIWTVNDGTNACSFKLLSIFINFIFHGTYKCWDRIHLVITLQIGVKSVCKTNKMRWLITMRNFAQFFAGSISFASFHIRSPTKVFQLFFKLTSVRIRAHANTSTRLDIKSWAFAIAEEKRQTESKEIARVLSDQIRNASFAIYNFIGDFRTIPWKLSSCKTAVFCCYSNGTG